MNVYEVITDRILALLDKGTVPWRQTWHGTGNSNAPKSLVSKKEYRGINLLLLGSQGYESPWWLTFNQAKAKGGMVRKGEKGTPVILWKTGERLRDGKKEKTFLLRYYTVFNLSQVDGIEIDTDKPVKPELPPIEACEAIVGLYKGRPPIDHGQGRAFYNPSFDRIGMPNKNAFSSAEEYYSTLFHELTHSTGHASRLDRDGITDPIRFGSHNYSFEELVAECGSAFLCGKAGIENRTIDNSAAYIASWHKKLKSEPKWIVEAAGKAAKAADYVQGVTYGEKKEDEEAAAAE